MATVRFETTGGCTDTFTEVSDVHVSPTMNEDLLIIGFENGQIRGSVILGPSEVRRLLEAAECLLPREEDDVQ